MDSILNQLIKHYYDTLKDGLVGMPHNDIKHYYIALVNKGNLVYMLDDDEQLMALLEFWLINKEQAERIINRETFIQQDEDTQSGDICYISEIWVRDDHRNNGGFKLIRTMQYKAERMHGKKAEVIFGKHIKHNDRFRTFKGGG